MKLWFIIFFFSFSVAKAQTAYWQQQVNYIIDVSLNDKEKTLDGYVKIEYINNSPDTLHYLWFHLWPNAYKNDKTAFSDQLLENGNTDFYFSDNDKRGYINRLDFKVNGGVVRMEDHPQHQDIIKIVLTNPLAPGSACKIETPFHEKLPYNFSRGGYKGKSFQLTQWYPKAAVYDSKGWHPMPYLDQGEFYNDFGNYQVQITVPNEYTVASTGELVSENKEATTKTLLYKQDNVTDFAWFANKNFIVQTDTMALSSGRIIKLAAYSLETPAGKDYWKHAIKYIKKAVSSREKLVGEYPYNTVSVVQGKMDYTGGMEYPAITLISGSSSARALESVIEHEVGHNWFQAIIATNEREHPWMDEGMNNYYKSRFKYEQAVAVKKDFIEERMPADEKTFKLMVLLSEKSDQPIETPSEKFSEKNYYSVAYHKAALWMKSLELTLGTNLFDSCMREYFRRWQFKHPSPEDFKRTMAEVSGRNLDNEFVLLTTKGNIKTTIFEQQNKFASFFGFKETEKYKYIFAGPVAGYNIYDKLMLGAAIHNYTLPENRFQFLFAPMYATGSKSLNGLGRLSYHWYPAKAIHKVTVGLNGASFSINHRYDTTGKKIFERFSKIVPYVRFDLHKKDRSTKTAWIDIRSFIIREKLFDNFDYIVGSDSVETFPKSFSSITRYVNQVSFNVENTRALYPYSYQLQLQQGKNFYRVNVTGNYFFNYSKGGGMQVRLYAAKFGYIGKDRNAFEYLPQLIGGDGSNDYTYSNYFLGRTASSAYGDIPIKNGGLAAQQLMLQNTGGLKFRMDKYDYLKGVSENWIAAINLSTTLPEKLFPVKIPLKVFFDAGTYAEAWEKDPLTPRILYTAGLQLSLFKDVLTIYAPLFYSGDFRNTLKTDPEQNKFSKKIFFSINLENISIKKLLPVKGI